MTGLDCTKVGVVTLPGAYNYGNRLQCYAVCEAYKMFGYNPVVLNRRPSRIKRIAKRVLGREWRTVEERMNLERAERFRHFNELIPQRYVRHPYVTLRKKYKLFSVGSDQTWNPRYITRHISWYFLRFAKKNQRIALAPSIGLSSLSAREGGILRRGVTQFRFLSVREQRGAELIKEYAGLDATVLCDPSFILSRCEWRAVSSDDVTPDGKYVFVYLLGEMQREVSDLVATASMGGSIPIVSLSDRDLPGEVKAGPSEFLSLIDNASHVVTDSFHAAVFSSIFQTPLTIVRRGGGHDIFSRIDGLVRMLGIEHKVYGSPSFDFTRAGDYKGVSEAIECERKKFMGYLEACLNA